MKRKEYFVPICETLTTIAPEVQRNLEMSLPTVKIEMKEEVDCNDEMNPCKPLQLSKYVNYYDSKEQMKKEIPDDECIQSGSSMSSKVVNEDLESLGITNRQQVKVVYKEERLSLDIIEEDEADEYQFAIKMERLEQQVLLDNNRITSIHYDVLVTPQKVHCKWCGKIFNNSFNLIKHNNQHIKVKINSPGHNEMNKLRQYQYSRNYFNNCGNMLAHVHDVHNKEQPKDGLCGQGLNQGSNVKGDLLVLHKLEKSSNRVTENSLKCKYCKEDCKDKEILYKHMESCLNGMADEKKKYKCDSCGRFYMSKKGLRIHVRKEHCDYGRMFDCWCGEQFPTPIHLSEHKGTRHIPKVLYNCKYCKAKYKVESNLISHMKRYHCDNGRKFECWCGKQLPSQTQLREHKKWHILNKPKRTTKIIHKCELCQKVLKTTTCLRNHIKNIHRDYGNENECWCGERFRTLRQLNEHKSLRHDDSINEKYICDGCQKSFTVKYNLVLHIKRMHYDYGKSFECWCGKQFRTPTHLNEHKRRHPNGNFINNAYNKKFQCQHCQIYIKSKRCLLKHIENIHCDEDKAFEYRCRRKLTESKGTQRTGNSKDKSIDKFQCDYCQKLFKFKRYLLRHILNSHYDYGNKMFECWCGKLYRTPLHLYDHRIKQHKNDMPNVTLDTSFSKQTTFE